MPLQRRLPKRGFNNLFRVEYRAVNIRDLARFETESSVGLEDLVRAGLVGKNERVKLLAQGDISRPITVRVHSASRTAKSKIEASGGSVELV